MKVITIAETASTNSWVAEHCNELHTEVVVRAESQTAGRGQRGNKWESEPFKNLTFSALLRPEHIPVAAQFIISQAVSLAIVEVLKAHLNTDISVKWPNDIYVGDKKICGILIENAVCGNSISRSIAGIGVNVNQTHFLSDAPNPVSMAQIAQRVFDLESLMQQFADAIERFMQFTRTPEGCEQLRHEYANVLYRREGIHTFAYPDGTRFEASIKEVSSIGMLTLSIHPANQLCRFAFKEVVFVV